MPLWGHARAKAVMNKAYFAHNSIRYNAMIFYATYFLFCELNARGVDGVFEQHGARRRSTDFRRGQTLGHRDHLIELQKPKTKPA
jgi:hypothetical protein